MEVVGMAGNGKEAVARVSELTPDVVLMDVNMPVMDGITATRLIKQDFPEVEVLVLTMLDGYEYLRGILDSGASGYILKTYGETDLINAIRSVYAKSPYLHPKAMKHLIGGIPVPSAGPFGAHELSPAPESPLTPREQEILRLYVKGIPDKEMSELLNISVKTVEAHKSKIKAKLQISTRAGLMKYAQENRLLDD
jgi:DNA-binding NarL/FixJ family response regulator